MDSYVHLYMDGQSVGRVPPLSTQGRAIGNDDESSFLSDPPPSMAIVQADKKNKLFDGHPPRAPPKCHHGYCRHWHARARLPRPLVAHTCICLSTIH
jgi:hypothetical protein